MRLGTEVWESTAADSRPTAKSFAAATTNLPNHQIVPDFSCA